MEIRLRYGDGTLGFDVPDDRVAGVWRPRAGDSGAPPVPLAPLVDSPGGEALRRAAHGARLLLLLPDETRGEPVGELAAAVLAAAGSPARVDACIATGSHRPDTPGNRALAAAVDAALRTAGAPGGPTGIHDCRSPRVSDHGPTRRGTPVRLASVLDDAEVVVAAGDVRPHYFAGYSNPSKCVLPGIAAFETIEANHRLTLEPGAEFGRHPFHPDPGRRDNPLADDMIEALDRALAGRPAFALAGVSSAGRRAWAALGPMRDTIGRAMAVVDERSLVTVPPARRVVVSAGGAPIDATLYLAQRALELTRAAIADGAEVLLLAECREGIAHSEASRVNFADELARPLPEVRQRIRRGYRLYQHKAYRFAEMIERVDRLMLASALPEDDVRRLHLEPAPDPRAVVAAWARESPAVPIAFLDEGHRLCVVAGAPA